MTASIEFSQEWVDGDPDLREIDVTVVHELLHCLFRDLDKAAESPLMSLSDAMRDMVEDRYDHELEQLIDRLAHVIVTNNGN